jgi:diaminopimelate decarboxylase
MKKLSNETLKLTPKLHPFVKRVIGQKDLLFELVDGFGSPLNLLFPQHIVENKKRFADVFEKHQVLGKVYYAHKTNQSSSLVKQLATEPNSFIDVASLGELKHALSCGFSGVSIGATGPKNEAFILLCIQHDVLISVDNQQELAQIIDIADKLNRKARITIRLNGFASEHVKVLTKTSRFGIPLKQIGDVLSTVAQSSNIELVGFAYHLDSTAIKERVIAIEALINFLDKNK